MNLPLNPKAIASEAIKSGALQVGELTTQATAITCHNLQIHTVRFPADVGLQPIRPTPKADGRKSPRLRPLKPNHRPRYVISKSQLLAQHPNLKLPN